MQDYLADDEFFTKSPELKDQLGEIKNIVADTCTKFETETNEKFQKRIEEIQADNDWKLLEEEDKTNLNEELQACYLNDKSGIGGIKEILNASYMVDETISTVKEQIAQYKKKWQEKGGKKIKTVFIPKQMDSKAKVEELIVQLQKVKAEMNENDIVQLKL